MYRIIQLVLLGLVAVVSGFAVLARRFPGVGWLQLFRYKGPPLSEAQRARIRQRSNIHAGIELILMGIVLPILYVVGIVMFFNEVTTNALVLVMAGSVLLIGLGVVGIWQNRRR